MIDDPSAQPKLVELRAELARLLKETGASPDAMPENPQLRFEMPEKSIR